MSWASRLLSYQTRISWISALAIPDMDYSASSKAMTLSGWLMAGRGLIRSIGLGCRTCLWAWVRSGSSIYSGTWDVMAFLSVVWEREDEESWSIWYWANSTGRSWSGFGVGLASWPAWTGSASMSLGACACGVVIKIIWYVLNKRLRIFC